MPAPSPRFGATQPHMTSSSEDKWNRRLLELARYQDKFGDCNVPVGFPENKGLGMWVATQRKQYRQRQFGKHSHMSDERMKKLESIGFNWIVREQGSQIWKKRCRELIEYRINHGDCRVPQKYPDNRALGSWVNDQRKQYKFKQEGRRTTLTDARIKELENIGFVWKEREVDHVPWEHQIRELIEYRNKHGDCKVPFHYSENRALAHWVANQRTHYTLKKAGKYSPMTDGRIRQLESIGFVWSCRDYHSLKDRAELNDENPETATSLHETVPDTLQVGNAGKLLLELRNHGNDTCKSVAQYK